MVFETLLSNTWVNVALITMVPWIELRASIPAGLAMGLDVVQLFIFVIIVNTLLALPLYIGLSLTYERFFKRFVFIRNIIERTHAKGKPYVEKYGLLGISLFIGIPLPGTGVWSGTLVAWMLGMKKRQALLAAFFGNLIAGIIVTIVSLGLFSLF